MRFFLTCDLLNQWGAYNTKPDNENPSFAGPMILRLLNHTRGSTKIRSLKSTLPLRPHREDQHLKECKEN